MNTTPWARLIPDARAFLTALGDNNTRDWFQANKPTYDQRLKAPALALMDVVAADLQRLTGHPTSAKLWRPHRDLRFSKDKTPYHLHLHIGWSTTTGGRQPLGWFFGISPQYVSLGAGVMAFDKAALVNWREAVSGPQGDTLCETLKTTLDAGYRIDPPQLKRVPAPYDKTHPHAELLRRKGLTLWRDDLQPDRDITSQLAEAFQDLRGIQSQLEYIL